MRNREELSNKAPIILIGSVNCWGVGFPQNSLVLNIDILSNNIGIEVTVRSTYSRIETEIIAGMFVNNPYVCYNRLILNNWLLMTPKLGYGLRKPWMKHTETRTNSQHFYLVGLSRRRHAETIPRFILKKKKKKKTRKGVQYKCRRMNP